MCSATAVGPYDYHINRAKQRSDYSTSRVSNTRAESGMSMQGSRGDRDEERER